MNAAIIPFFHERTNTVTYIVSDPASRRAAVIDPVRDYDAASGRTGRGSVDKVIERVRADGLAVDWVLETHVHADHLSAAPLAASSTVCSPTARRSRSAGCRRACCTPPATRRPASAT